MRKLLVFLTMFLTMNVFSKDLGKVVFEKDNFFAITSEFNEDLYNDFAEKVYGYNDKTLTIYFDSPGGSVFSLARIVGLMASSKVNFICIARFAASAAFIMFEHCNERYLLPEGILMSHNASGSLSGEIPRMRHVLDMIEGVLDQLDTKVAERMKIPLLDYKGLIANELWMNRTLAEKYNAIDGVATDVSCSKDLVKRKVQKSVQYMTLFGAMNVRLESSACPLITRVKKINSKDSDESSMDAIIKGIGGVTTLPPFYLNR